MDKTEARPKKAKESPKIYTRSMSSAAAYLSGNQGQRSPTTLTLHCWDKQVHDTVAILNTLKVTTAETDSIRSRHVTSRHVTTTQQHQSRRKHQTRPTRLKKNRKHYLHVRTWACLALAHRIQHSTERTAKDTTQETTKKHQCLTGSLRLHLHRLPVTRYPYLVEASARVDGALEDGLIHHLRQWRQEVRRHDLRRKEHLRSKEPLVPHVRRVLHPAFLRSRRNHTVQVPHKNKGAIFAVKEQYRRRNKSRTKTSMTKNNRLYRAMDKKTLSKALGICSRDVSISIFMTR